MTSELIAFVLARDDAGDGESRRAGHQGGRMAGLGDWMELGESGEMVAAREEEPSPSGGWLRYFRGWVEATGRGPGLWEMVRSWT